MTHPVDDPDLRDRCGVCDAPLEGEGTLVEAEDGTLVMACPACVGQTVDTAADPLPDAASSTLSDPTLDQELALDEPEDDRAGLREIAANLIANHAAAGRQLDLLVHAHEELEADYAGAQGAIMELESRIRSLEAELERTRGRLRRAEGLLGSTGEQPVVALDSADTEIVESHFPAAPGPIVVSASDLTGEDVRLAQRYYNDSGYTGKIKSVRRSLGRPTANVVKVAGAERNVLITIAWDIVWYQFLVDVSLGTEGDRVELFGEGMELSELSEVFKRANAAIDDSGRLDASELELSLEHDHPAHAESTTTGAGAGADAGEDEPAPDVWDRTDGPIFRWDD